MWRNTALRAELFPGVDGRVVIALLIWALHMKMWTFCIFLATCFFFWFIGRKGYSITVAMLRLRRLIVGNVRAKWSAHEYKTRSLPTDMVAP